MTCESVNMMNDISGPLLGATVDDRAGWDCRLVPTVLLKVGAFALLETRSYSSRLSAESEDLPF